MPTAQALPGAKNLAFLDPPQKMFHNRTDEYYTGLWYGNDIAGGHDAATASRDIFIEDDLWGNFHINVVLLGSTAKP